MLVIVCICDFFVKWNSFLLGMTKTIIKDRVIKMEKNGCLTTNRVTVLLTFIFMFLFLPEYVQINTLIRYIYYVIGSIISIYFCLNGILALRKKVNRCCVHFLYEVIVFYTILLSATVINSGQLKTAYFAHAAIGIGACSLVLYEFNKHKAENILKALIISLEIYVTINLISVFVYPDGLYVLSSFSGDTTNAGYILGHRNNSIEYCIPLVGFNILLELYHNKKYSINHCYCLFISIITVVLTWSVNAILCMIFITVMDLYVVKKEKAFIGIKNLYLSSACLSVLIIVYNVQSYFSDFLTSFFHRSVTFSSRTRIWSKSLEAICNNYLFGYGIEENVVKYQRIGHPNSCHNYFLDFLYYGGIVLLVDVSAMILSIVRRFKNLDSIIKSRIAVVFGSYFILWIATPIHRNYLFIMFVFFMSSISIPWEKRVQCDDGKKFAEDLN